MSALFSPSGPDIPTLSDEEIEEERRRKIAALEGAGRAGTLLTGGGITDPILGSAARLTGGIV